MRYTKSKIIIFFLAVGCFAMAASPCRADNFGAKKRVSDIPAEHVKAPKKETPDFFGEIVFSNKNVNIGETVIVDYWLYLARGAVYEGLNIEPTVRGHLINILIKRLTGKWINSEDAWAGLFMTQDDKKRFIAKAPAANTPAAGLVMAKDVVEMVNGRKTTDFDEMIQILRELKAGVPAEIVIVRNGVRQTISITPRKFADDSHVFNQTTVQSLRIHAEDKPPQGVTVISGPEGILEGDVIMEVGDKSIHSWDDWCRAATNTFTTETVSVKVLRGSQPIVVSVRPETSKALITAEPVPPTKVEEFRRSEITIEGKRYVKARVYSVRFRFDASGKYMIVPGAAQVRPDIVKPALLPIFGTPKPVYGDVTIPVVFGSEEIVVA